MTTGRHSQVFHQLRQAVLAHEGAGLTDADLMSRFVAQRDGDALEALIRRHASMVWSVCRRVLSNEQDAEDAFQASFLVFVRKAASLPARSQVGNWLYGVAYRTALKARSMTARRRDKERRAAAMTPARTQTDESWAEWLPRLDQELARLPEKYRTALVLCELEGRPRKDAARQLGIPEGTLSSRLATGRRMLAKRFGRPGLALSAGALAGSAAVPPTLLASTVKAVSTVAVDGAVVASVVSVRVASLAEGVIKAMLLTRISAGAVLLAVVAVFAAGTGTVVYSEAAPRPDPKPPTPPIAVVQHLEDKKDKQEVKNEESEWGEAVDGVQVRLRKLKPTPGTLDFAVDVRNRGEHVVLQDRSLAFCPVDWDGKRCSFLTATGQEFEMCILSPGKQIDDWVKVSLDAGWSQYHPGADLPQSIIPLQVDAGKHTLRVTVRFDRGPMPVSQPMVIEIDKGSEWGIKTGKVSDWGEPVDRVQARIRTRKAVWGLNEAPTFHLDLRNLGERKPHAMRNPYAGEIEADGAWYHYSRPVEIKAEDKALEPGKQIDDWVEITPDKLWLNESHKTPIDPKDYLSLKPGKHTLRIAVTLAGEKWIRPISGPIEIEVSEKAPADKPPDAVTAPTKSEPMKDEKATTKEAAPRADANETPARRAVDIRKKLNETINFELAIDTTLDKALDELLTTRRGIPWSVNDAAFGPDNKDIVKKTPVEKMGPITGVTVATLLNRLLAKIPSEGGRMSPMYLIRPDSVEITTRGMYSNESHSSPNRTVSDLLPDYLHLPPPVYAVFDKVPLSEALAELGRTTGGTVIVAGYASKEAETKVTAELNGVPLDAAVTVLADMAELRCVCVGNIYYVTTPERARALAKEEQERRLDEDKGKEEPAKPPGPGDRM